MLKFNYLNETSERYSKAFFEKNVEALYKSLKPRIERMLKKRSGRIDLILVNDKTIKDLNSEYRKKDKSTDVISFAYLEVTEFEKLEGDIIVGDVFISIDTAKKQAKSHNHSIRKELLILFTHGLLHLFGYDHRNDKEEDEMEKEARKILKLLNY